MGIGPGRLRFWAASQHASSALVFAGGARRLRGAMPQANEEFEKVRWLWAELVLNSKYYMVAWLSIYLLFCRRCAGHLWNGMSV